MTNDTHAPSARVRWARLRFQILGTLMAAPADDGELKARIEALAARAWRHPTTGESIRFSFKTIERWWYIARGAEDRQPSIHCTRCHRRCPLPRSAATAMDAII